MHVHTYAHMRYHTCSHAHLHTYIHDESVMIFEGTVVHYTLPMDVIQGRTIVNPSGLDASVSGSVVPGRGIVRNAIQVNGRETYIRVTGPGHRLECFGDLDQCTLGIAVTYVTYITFMEVLPNSASGQKLTAMPGKMWFSHRILAMEIWTNQAHDLLYSFCWPIDLGLKCLCCIVSWLYWF